MAEDSSNSQAELVPHSDATSDAPAPEWDPAWPEADILVVPGIPGWADTGADRGVENPYPSSTSDFVKEFRLEGFRVQHTVSRGDRSPVSINAADLWVPVLIFALQDVAQVPSELLSTAILKVFGRWLSDDSRLHVRFMQKGADGTIHEFKADGRASDVLRAMQVFGDTHRVAEGP